MIHNHLFACRKGSSPEKAAYILIGFLVSFVLVFQGIPGSAAGRYDAAVARWVSQLRTEIDVETRVEAADGLGYHNTPDSLEALAEALVKDASELVRQQAASSLWKLSPDIEAARQSLFKSLDDPFPGVRVRSSWALQNGGIEPGKLAEARRSAIADPRSDTFTRFWAAFGLIGIDPPATLLNHILEYIKPRIRSKAAERAILELVEQQDRSIIEPMETMVRMYHKGNALVLKGLQKFNPQPERLVELLCLQFDFKDIELEREILLLLRDQGETEAEVQMWLPEVKPYLLGKDDTARLFALGALERAGGLAVDAVPEIVVILEKSRDTRLRGGAADAIGAIGDRNKPYPEEIKKTVSEQAVTQLAKMMRSDPDRSNRVAAVRALDKLKTDGAALIPQLLDVAKNDSEVPVRVAALSAIGARGAEGSSILADIKALAEGENRAVKQAATDALTMITRQENRAAQTLVPEKGGSPARQKTAMAALRSVDAGFDENGFMLALNSNDTDKVRAYLDSGISANYQFKATHDRPALNEVFTRAATYLMRGKGTPEKLKNTLRLLLERGADPGRTDKMGNTALMSAALACDGETLKMLLDAGADPNVKNKAGLTALEFTFALANPGADALLDAGARIPKNKVEGYLQAYGKNPETVALIKRAAENPSP